VELIRAVDIQFYDTFVKEVCQDLNLPIVYYDIIMAALKEEDSDIKFFYPGS